MFSYKHKLIINQSLFLIVEANYIDQSMANCLIADHLDLNPCNDKNVTYELTSSLFLEKLNFQAF
jgi:hypothetical protein